MMIESINALDTFPKILLHNAKKYGDNKIAIREKDYGIWQSYSWKDYFDQTRDFIGSDALSQPQIDRIRWRRIEDLADQRPLDPAHPTRGA